MKPLVLALCLLLPAMPAPAQVKAGDLGSGFNEITQAIADAKKKSADESAKAAEAAAAAEKAKSAVQPWTFEQANAEFWGGPGHMLIGRPDIDKAKGRWVLAAYADDQANTEGVAGKEAFASLKAPRRSLELSRDSFRFAGGDWHRLDANEAGELAINLEEAGEGGSLTDHYTFCSKVTSAKALVCRTTSVRTVHEKADHSDPGKVAEKTVSYSKYVRP